MVIIILQYKDLIYDFVFFDLKIFRNQIIIIIIIRDYNFVIIFEFMIHQGSKISKTKAVSKIASSKCQFSFSKRDLAYLLSFR